MKSKEDAILINVLTRTSNRPLGFENCHKSVINQTYKNVRHIVSYEDEKDLEYLNKFNVIYFKVEKFIGEKPVNTTGYKFAPYNSYCNLLLKHVNEGWILFLDDDDNLLHSKVFEELVTIIKKVNDNTMIIWQMRFPDGSIVPSKNHFKNKKIEIDKIGSPCMLFHSKFKNMAVWDNFKGSDFRFIEKLNIVIPNKKWIQKVYIQINNFGDFGKRNDINPNKNLSFIYKKSFYWFLIPKYHFEIFNIKFFNVNTYKKNLLKLYKRIKKKIQIN